MEKPKYSVVVPLYNESGNVVALHEKIVAAMRSIGQPFEVIFVDDGSSDATVEECHSVSPLKLIEFRKNFGQTAAFDAGFKAAQGEIIITMDGDLQNDPADIPRVLEPLEKGYDIVSGWRQNRKGLDKRFFSRGANLLRRWLIKDGIHDSGCSLKAYRTECFHDVDLFGEMHRFIPAILQMQGYRVTEVPVQDHPRIHGLTKYNWKRAMKGFVDMLTIWFWRRYANRPVHLLGGGGLLVGFVGAIILLWMAFDKIVFGAQLSQRIWPLVGLFLVLAGLQMFIFGLMADILVKNYYRGRQTMNYSIKKIIER
ncbi:MAG: glycosyltransferase family 2 protein [Candidatus Moraniibacteriota bacterium]